MMTQSNPKNENYPFELPAILSQAIKLEKYQSLFVFDIDGQGHTWVLVFHHGKANEVGNAVLEEIEQLGKDLEAPTGPQSLISLSLRRSSKGTPIFIAGANVTERTGWDNERVKRHVRQQRAILQKLRQAPIFHICLISGLALGWGTEYLITADYKIATPEAAFALPETGLGILPGAGGTSELASLIGPAHTLRLGMTGERIKAEEALRIGLVQEMSKDLPQALERALTLTNLISRKSPIAIAAFKQGLLSSLGKSSEQRSEIEAQAYERCVDSGEAAIGRRDFHLIKSGETPNWGKRS